MVYFKAYGDNYKQRFHLTEDTDRLPEGIRSFEVDFEKNVPECEVDEKTLIKLLRNSPKIRRVTISHVDELSPERAELLALIISCAESLCIKYWGSDVAYSCLASCLPQANGPKEIRFDESSTVSADQARLVFEGVASSPCLQNLCFATLRFEAGSSEDDYESICNAFLDALQRNRSLNVLSFDVSPFLDDDFVMFSRIFKAAILDTKIESLSMCYGYQGTLLLPSDLFREVLSHRDCSLKGLHLYDINFEPARIDSLLSNAVNKTVQNLSAESSDELDLSAFVEVAVMFRSLVSLELRQCNISDPSPLYPLLIGGGGDGEGLTLARLQLWGNQIGQHSAIDFCGKLPQMTCLRDLCLGQNPFLFERRWVNILADAVQGNKSLECLGLDMMHEASPINQEELKGAFCKMDEALNRNSERRLYMEFEVSARSKVLPKNLWPLVLEKAQRISLSFYKTFEQRWEKQPVELLKVDLVNRLLKQKMQHEHLYEY